jgi:hypothetical protein
MKKSSIIFSTANLIGMLICLAFVAGTRQQALMEQRDSYDFGDSLHFIMIVLPVLGVCLLLNIVWGVVALIAVLRRRDYRSALGCLVVAALWAVVIPVARGIASLPLNPAASGNGASASLCHIVSLERAVPEKV